MENNASGLPFRWAVLDNFAPAELIADIPVPGVDWPLWTWYENDCERNKSTCRDFNALGPKWQWLFDWLNTPMAAASWGNWVVKQPLVPDPSLHGSGLHVSWPFSWLQPHLDFVVHPDGKHERRLSCVLFLSPEWKEAYGGALEFYAPDGTTVLQRVWPAFNRAVFWESSDLAYHGVSPTSPNAPPRVTAAVYYLGPLRPGSTRCRALFCPRRK